MKKKYISIRIIAILAICMVIPSLAVAQTIRNGYVNIDWQLNSPINNTFAGGISGWGAQAEAGYYVTPEFSVGGFFSFHTNNEYIGRSTVQTGQTSAVTSDQQHSIFQIPFGAALRYTFGRRTTGLLEPYVGAKVGTAYSEVSSYLNIFKAYERKWGFFVSPEIGTTIYFNQDKTFGLHVAAYYSYSTNKSAVLGYNVDGLNNWGFRFGIAF